MSKYIDAEHLANKIKKSLEFDERIHTDFYIGRRDAERNILGLIHSLQQEQEEVELEKFTEKMDAWKARYNYPDNIMVKGAMAFTARMFYMYPKVAREWYDSLPKVTQD